MLPTVRFKERPEDFVVDEIPAYSPSGEGDHLFVTFRKVGLTTHDAVAALARALAAPARDAGVAGMKDKVSVSTQTASFQLPRAVDPAPLLAACERPDLAILSAIRHTNKLKPGHLDGNRFTIWLRGVTDDLSGRIEAALATVNACGFPNHFGAQRFGRGKDNAQRALAFVRGETRPPRDKGQVRLLFSALQSDLFNRVLDRRIADGTWCQVLPGDLAKKRDTGGLFAVPDAGPELEDAQRRALELGIAATGPMFGSSMRSPTGPALVLETEILEASGVTADQLERFRHAGEGTRRPLRLVASELAWQREPDSLRVSFVLPKGGYATTLLQSLQSVCNLVEGGAAEQTAEESPGESVENLARADA